MQEILELGYTIATDPFLGPGYKSNETYIRTPKDTFETWKYPLSPPYETYRFFIFTSNSDGFMYIVDTALSRREKVNNIADINKKIKIFQEMKKLKDAL